MINTNKLRGAIVENGMTQEKVAEELGITARSFTRKMKMGIFNSDEIYKMIHLLNIADPVAVFFADEVA